jgi:hypothetical protein
VTSAAFSDEDVCLLYTFVLIEMDCNSDPAEVLAPMRKGKGREQTRPKRITNSLKYMKSNRKPLLGIMLSLDTFYGSHNQYLNVCSIVLPKASVTE